MSRRAIAVVVAALALAAGVRAQPVRGRFWRWWENPAIAGDIGLLPEQAAAIARAQAESRTERADGVTRLRAARVRLGELLNSPEVDLAAVVRVLGRIGRLQREQLRSVVHLRLRVRRILTREQLARLLARYPELMQRPWDRG
jgi:Spy/CpxP family protein refolding chaperone